MLRPILLAPPSWGLSKRVVVVHPLKRPRRREQKSYFTHVPLRFATETVGCKQVSAGHLTEFAIEKQAADTGQGLCVNQADRKSKVCIFMESRSPKATPG